MRVITLARKLIGVIRLRVDGVRFAEHGLVFAVRPRWHLPRCGGCGRRASVYDQRPCREWRHLSLGSLRTWLSYAPRRTSCRRCGVRTEQVPWAVGRSGFTEPFEELVAYLAQVTDKTTVTNLTGIAWMTVGRIVKRVVERKLAPDRLDNLTVIGIDEFSYRKRHRYVTVVVDHEQRRIVWAAKGRGAKTLSSFFEFLGEERRKCILAATIDMAGGYIKAIEDWLPNATIVFDRFHVQRLVSDAVDEVRRQEVRELSNEPGAAKELKGSRFALLKSPWNLRRRDHDKLRDVQRTNARVYRAYLLKETLAQALDYVQPGRAVKALDEWLAWASRSKLKPFVKVARTIRRYKDGIIAYIESRFTNGIVEGFNNRFRMVARRAFGYHSASALIAMMFLCCGGITLDPPLP